MFEVFGEIKVFESGFFILYVEYELFLFLELRFKLLGWYMCLLLGRIGFKLLW